MADEQVIDSPRGWVADHIREYVETDGKKGHMWKGVPTLLLTTRGRRSGKLRRTALIYGRLDDHYVVVGSQGGAPTHPQWYLNLLADPNVVIQVGAETHVATARDATAAERPLLWEQMVELFPNYEEYQKKTERQIPLVVIEASGPYPSD